MLAAIWVLLTIVFAVLVWISSSLVYTSGFLAMLGVTGALLLNNKWIYAIIGVCVTVLLLAAAFYFEPGWFDSVLKVFSFTD